MQKAKTSELSDKLMSFIAYVEQSLSKDAAKLTVNDLRVEVRAERLTELSAWRSVDLDAIEEEAALHGDETCVAELGSADRDTLSLASARSVTWPDAPSPLAWT